MFKQIRYLNIPDINGCKLGCMMSLVFIIFLYASPVSAHRVTIFAWIEGDVVHTQSKFGSGRKAVDALVEVFDESGTKLLEGRSDTNGEFSFHLPKKTALKIILQAGAGHRAEWEISAADIKDALGNPPVSEKESPPGVVKNTSQPAKTGQPHDMTEGMVTLEASEIQKMIDASLDKKLAPIMKALAETYDKGPDIRDIIGGIGYILGLVGVALYVTNRCKKE